MSFVSTLWKRGGVALATLLATVSSAYAADPGIYKDRIVIGAYLPLQSGLAAGSAQLRAGADAYFQHINEQGGIHGRKILYGDNYSDRLTTTILAGCH